MFNDIDNVLFIIKATLDQNNRDFMIGPICENIEMSDLIRIIKKRTENKYVYCDDRRIIFIVNKINQEKLNGN